MRLLIISLLLPLIGGAQVFNIDALRKLTGPGRVYVEGYYTPGDGGGGWFYWDALNEQPDNLGTIIRPNNLDMGRWIRETNGRLNLKQFGAKGDTITDCRQALINLRDAAKNRTYLNNPSYFSLMDIEIPAGGYRLSDSVEFHGMVNIIGTGGGTGQRLLSQFWIDAGKGGLYFHENGSFGAAFSTVSNIAIIGRGTQGRLDKHGIFSSARIYITNCYLYNMPGDGIRIDSRYGGQPDLCEIRNCELFYNQGYGISFWGFDANQCSIYNLNTHANGLSNIHDESALGNNYYSTHSSYAGIRQNFVRGYTKSNGKAYYCWNKNKGIKPGVSANWQSYWVEMTQIFFDSTQYSQWHPDSTYYDALPFWGMGPAATNELFGFYTEGGQPAVALSGYSTWWGGTSGTGTVMPYMTFLKTQNGKFNFASGVGFTVPDRLDHRDYFAATSANGAEWGTDRTGGGRLQARYYYLDSAVRWAANSTGLPGYFQPTVNYRNHPEFGRSLVQAGVIVTGQYGMYLSSLSDGGEGNFKLSKKRLFASGSGTPTVMKEYAVGDFLLDNTGDTLTIGWKCIEKGTPGKWVRIKSCN